MAMLNNQKVILCPRILELLLVKTTMTRLLKKKTYKQSDVGNPLICVSIIVP